MSTSLTNLVSSRAELCENQEKLQLQATGKERLFGFDAAKFPISVEKRPGRLPGQGAEGGFVIGTCAFGYVEGVFLKDLKQLVPLGMNLFRPSHVPLPSPFLTFMML